MNKIFDEVSVAGIVSPGDIYIFCDDQERGSAPGPLEYLYIIRNEKEILRALDMELCIVMAEYFEPIKFLGVRKVNASCHEFNMLCYDRKSNEELKYTLYLQRIQSFEESLIQVKKIFRVTHNGI